ncbi:hypothetical protein EGW08_014186 [Elysia chlorotica]|uniref:Uncharacterized protein n=1 Tax=Elysia chlorotica TaxID=188477 RepID=A0A3S1HF16_ELYCH|nr:hypothetical protein EGW08_014186 [Elysia chlorotica]
MQRAETPDEGLRFKVRRCQGTARPIDGRPQSEVQVGSNKLDVVASFCYLGDMLSAAGGCDLATTTRVKTAWKKFKELLPVLLSRHLSYKTWGHVYSTCVRSAMLHASETWPLTKPNLQRLQRNDRAMIRQICNVKPEDVATTRSNELLTLLGLEDLNLILKERRLRWRRAHFGTKKSLCMSERWGRSPGPVGKFPAQRSSLANGEIPKSKSLETQSRPKRPEAGSTTWTEHSGDATVQGKESSPHRPTLNGRTLETQDG